MSYLDSLEDNLKALERQEEKDPEAVRKNHQKREAERNSALARAPYVEALKTSAFTSDLLTACRTIGHGQRVLVQFVWIGENLRLDAKTKRMELVPEADGIVAVCSVDGVEVSRTKINTETDDPNALAQRWLTGE